MDAQPANLEAKFADVSVNVAAIDKSFSYSIPPELRGKIQPGCLVVVPFGKQIVQGVVLALSDKLELEANIRDILSLNSEETVLTPQQLQLTHWIARETFAPLGAAVNLMLPRGLSQRADFLAELNPDPPETSAKPAPLQARILKLLKERGPLRGAQLERALPKLEWRPSLERMREAGLVRTTSVFPPPRVNPKVVRTAQLTITPEAVKALEPQALSLRPETGARRLEVLRLLAAEPFPMDFSWIYAQTNCSYADLKALAGQDYLHFNETEVWRDPLENLQVESARAPVLTPDQQRVWAQLLPRLGQAESKPVLLHGVTGSGKTEIYLRAVEQCLAQGRQAVVLVPEIAMTPQAVRRYMARFPNRVGLYHSKLSEGELYDTWRRARKGELAVIVGARSALFVPLPDIGLIILDECDHESYDETEREPFYRSVETAEAYAHICGANLILGSATPRVSQYYRAKKGSWQLLELPRRVLAHRETLLKQSASLRADLLAEAGGDELLNLELPSVDVVDMRVELKAGNTSVLSRALRAGLEQVLERNQQAILFLNRKGSATYVFCRDCGSALLCPRDLSPLVYHQGRDSLLCHICGYTRGMPAKCPNCGSKQIRQMGVGTERLETIVRQAFPQARLLRWDAETTTTRDAHELILSHFSAHRADILIGTQMLAKGLDLPLVTLVGIVLAETGLNLPDYRAAERVFQVLTQVSGRAGRSPLGGRVVLQTYEPENTIIQAASRHDFAAFYAQELAHRRELGYPPFTRLVRLEYRSPSEEKCRQEAELMAQVLRAEIQGLGLAQTDFIGPVPCYTRKLFGRFRWQIILRGPDPTRILNGLPLMGWIVEVDPPNLL